MKDGVINDPHEIGRRFGQIREALQSGVASVLAEILPAETPRPQPKRSSSPHNHSIRVAEEQLNIFPSAPKSVIPGKLPGQPRGQAKRKRAHVKYHSESIGWIQHSVPNGDLV